MATKQAAQKAIKLFWSPGDNALFASPDSHYFSGAEQQEVREGVSELLLLLAYEPAVARQLRAAVWVGQRRWNLVLNNRVEIWLPEEDAVAALQQLAKLDDKHKLLSREFGVVDLRLPDKLYLRKRGPGEPAPGPV